MLRLFPASMHEMFMWKPLPAWSARGLGEKSAYSPALAALVRTIHLNVVALSAAVSASEWWKSISFCPGPSSWWLASG